MTVEALRIGREKIANPAMWWQSSHKCPRGGTCMAFALDHTPMRCHAIDALAEVIGDYPSESAFEIVTEFNDTHTHAEALAVYDEAIRRAEES